MHVSSPPELCHGVRVITATPQRFFCSLGGPLSHRISFLYREQQHGHDKVISPQHPAAIPDQTISWRIQHGRIQEFAPTVNNSKKPGGRGIRGTGIPHQLKASSFSGDEVRRKSSEEHQALNFPLFHPQSVFLLRCYMLIG